MHVTSRGKYFLKPVNRETRFDLLREKDNRGLLLMSSHHDKVDRIQYDTGRLQHLVLIDGRLTVVGERGRSAQGLAVLSVSHLRLGFFW